MRRAFLLLAAAAALPSPASAGPREAALLERHRPILRYDADERHFAVSVDALTSASVVEREDGPRTRVRAPGFLGPRYADGHETRATDRLVATRTPGRGAARVYGRAARDGSGGRWLQYWLFFTGNTQDRGVLSTGRHRGDWELMQLRLGDGGRPVEATFGQHSWAEGCRWTDLEREGPAPVVYVANGAHSLYPRAGRADRPFPDPNDEADGRGPRSRPPLEVVGGRSPRWMAWPGRWGEDEGGWVPGEQPSPRGPAFQPARWDDPGRFHDAEARACGSGPPGRPWQTVVTVVLAAALMAGAGRLVLRSYNRRP